MRPLTAAIFGPPHLLLAISPLKTLPSTKTLGNWIEKCSNAKCSALMTRLKIWNFHNFGTKFTIFLWIFPEIPHHPLKTLRNKCWPLYIKESGYNVASLFPYVAKNPCSCIANASTALHHGLRSKTTPIFKILLAQLGFEPTPSLEVSIQIKMNLNTKRYLNFPYQVLKS